MSYVAGHTFKFGVCTCGRKWVDIMHVDDTCLDMEGYAHTGRLSQPEINQIKAERERLSGVFERATKNGSGGHAAEPSTEAPEAAPAQASQPDYSCFLAH